MSIWWRHKQPQKTPVRSGVLPGWAEPWSNVVNTSYADVDPSQGTASLQKVAIWSSIDLIGSLVSEMPVDVLRNEGDRAKPIQTPSYLADPAGDGHGYQDWCWKLLLNWLTGGNNFGKVLARDRRGNFPVQVDLLPPQLTTGTLESDGAIKWTLQGREIPTEQMWHLRVFPRSGQVLGLSPIGHHIVTVAQGLASARFGAQFVERFSRARLPFEALCQYLELSAHWSIAEEVSHPDLRRAVDGNIDQHLSSAV